MQEMINGGLGNEQVKYAKIVTAAAIKTTYWRNFFRKSLLEHLNLNNNTLNTISAFLWFMPVTNQTHPLST